MTDYYVGEIRIWPIARVPEDFVLCDGRLLPIQQFAALYSLIGTIYGGDGTTTFAVPDLRGRLPVGAGQGPGLSNHPLGAQFGAETATLTLNQIPAHSHSFNAVNGPATSLAPTPNGATLLATSPSGATHFLTEGTSGETVVQLGPTDVGNTGGNQPHDNRMPTIAVNYIIAVNGLYPNHQ
jgi:microcystin-dependent protein